MTGPAKARRRRQWRCRSCAAPSRFGRACHARYMGSGSRRAGLARRRAFRRALLASLVRRRRRDTDFGQYPPRHLRVDEQARAVGALDPAVRRQVQIDARMPHRSAPAIAGRDCVIGFDRLEGHAVSSGDAGAPIDRAAAAVSRPLRRAVLAALLLLPLAGMPVAEEMAASFGAAATHLAPSASPARFTDSAFIAADGVSLPLRKWLPQGEVKAVILALHGFNDYSNAFTMPAPLWAEHGIATYAYDQRGFGGAPMRASWAGSARLAGDAVTATRLLRAIYPGRPIYLLGESMGGGVAILAASG